jgi:hypothetical protein
MEIETSDSGEYREKGSVPKGREFGKPKELDRFTVYVKYKYGDDPQDYSIEEIDVDAKNRKHASLVAKAALERDYEPGGRVIKITFRPKGFMYL